MKLNKKAIIVELIAALVLIVGCTYNDDKYNDDNYSDDPAVNVERCLQSLEDGTAYEIDEALTAKAPWEKGDIVAKFRDGEGGYNIRKFLGITKAGHYLVQGYNCYEDYELKVTEPFALMSLCAVIDKWKSISIFSSNGIPSACGSYTGKTQSPKIKGVFLDGVKDGEWVSFKSNGDIWHKRNYKDGVLDGVAVDYFYDAKQLQNFYWYENGQWCFTLTFHDNGKVSHVSILEEYQNFAFVEFDGTDKTIQYGFLRDGNRAGLWRKWNTQGVLLEEIDYDLS